MRNLRSNLVYSDAYASILLYPATDMAAVEGTALNLPAIMKLTNQKEVAGVYALQRTARI